MRRAARPVAGLVALAGLCSALAACGASTTAGNGVAGERPARILARASAAAKSAATVRVAGSILDGGTPISLNMELVANKGGEGRVAIGGSTLALRELDGYLYVKADAAFDERLAGRAAGGLLGGRWLVGRAAAPALRDLAQLTSLDALLGAALGAHGADLARSGSATFAGRPAVAVSDRAGGGTMYVAATGAPYPLEIVWNGAKNGKLVFESWNQAAEPEAPAHAISIKQLQSRG
ncbi:MAG TPA: hypothetical protein VGY13_05650 [Solirubrobacteraceae bacterium]|jgi:hypothetical protein|nr:hypothetical protein [Solirubrobacteraceae bacterium]